MTEYDCISCTETLFGRPYTIVNDQVCGECILHIFNAAVEHEANFPPKWGGTVLDPEQYRQVLNPACMQRYAQRKAEWSIEALDRIYCNARPRGAVANCGNFLGGRSGQMTLAQCAKCQAWTCRRCRELVAGGRNANHRCDPNVERQDRARAFEGLERGKHYQKCPRCERQYALGDGCHHVQCGHPCMAWFCFICGAECSDGYDHFSQRPGDGKCELYPPNRNQAAVDYNGGAPAAPPVFDPGAVADLDGVFGPRGNVRAGLRQEQEQIMRGLGGGIGVEAARQLGQALALWQDPVPQAGPRDPFAHLRPRDQNQNVAPGNGYQQALVRFAREAQDQGAGQGQAQAAPGGEVPLDDRLDEILQVLGRGTSRLLALLEFYCDNPDERFLVNARVLHNDLLNRWQQAQRSVEQQPRTYQWAVDTYQHLQSLRDDDWTIRIIRVAFTPHLWQEWVASNVEDPRVERITIVAAAERPGGLFGQQPDFGDQLLGPQLRGLLGQARAGNLEQQAGGLFVQPQGVALGQPPRGILGGWNAGIANQQAGPRFNVNARGLQPQGALGQRPRGLLGGWSGRL